MIQDILTEQLLLRELKYLSTIDYERYGKKDYKNENERKKHYETMKMFCNNAIKNKGITEHEYRFSKDTPDHSGGRIFSKNGIQGMPKKIRGFLMKHTTDIDMKNAHPTILFYLCKLHQIKCPSLDFFIRNREELIGNGVDREVRKNNYLKALNDDKINYKITEPFFRNFDKEMKDIQKIICNLPDYQNILKNVPADKKERNLYGSCINRILCKYENLILRCCKNTLKEKNIEVAVNMFDGCMVYGDYYNDEQLLKDIENACEIAFNGLNMKWAYKSHDDTIKIPDDFDESKVVEKKLVKNDLEATEAVFNLYPNWVYCDGTLYVFDENTGLWSDDKTIYFDIIKTFQTAIYIDDNKSYGNTLSLMEKIPPLMKTFCKNNDWLNQKSSSSLGYILLY